MTNNNHFTHLESSNSFETNSYKFDQYGNILVGTIDDLLYDKFVEENEEKSKIEFNWLNNNSKIKSMNSLVSFSSNLKDINNNSNIKDNANINDKGNNNNISEDNKIDKNNISENYQQKALKEKNYNDKDEY